MEKKFRPLFYLLIILFVCANLTMAQSKTPEKDLSESVSVMKRSWQGFGFSEGQAAIISSLYFIGTADYGKAEKCSETIKNSEIGSFLIAESVFRRGNFKKANRLFEKVSDKYPENSLALLRIGTILMMQDNYEKAEEVLNRAAALDKENVDVQLQLGRLYVLRGDSPAKALTSLRSAFSGYQESTELNYEIGGIYYEKGSFKEAEYFFDRAVKLGGREEKYRIALAKAMYYQGKNDLALKEIRRVLKSSKRSQEANYFLGAIQLERKRYSRAIQAFRKAERKGKSFGDSRYYIGKIKFFQGLHQEAIRDLLQYRVAKIVSGEDQGANFQDSMKTILDIESILKIERLPHQIPGSREGMILVRGRELFFGWDGKSERTDEQRLEIERFLLDAVEVSTDDYAVFVKAAGWKTPEVSGRGEAISKMLWNREALEPGETASQLPVTFVSWKDAMAYAAWAGKRLPRESEWELAARGKDIANPYPWGDKGPNRDIVVFSADRGPGFANAGYCDENGFYNIVGNVAEWCLGDSDSKKKPYRGGHWRSVAEDLKVFIRGELSQQATNAFVGFRCASEYIEEE